MSEWGCLGLSMNRGFYTPSFMDTSRIIFTSPIAPKFEKRNFQKRENISSWCSWPSPPPYHPSSTTLSVKTTSSRLSRCFCRQPPPPHSFYHLHDHPVHHLLDQPSREFKSGIGFANKVEMRQLKIDFWPNGDFGLTQSW